MRKKRKEEEEILMDLEIEDRVFTFMDSSRPLLIDSVNTIGRKSMIYFVIAMVLIVATISICAPKSHFVEYMFYKVSNNNRSEYSFRMNNLYPEMSKMWLSAVTFKNISSLTGSNEKIRINGTIHKIAKKGKHDVSKIKGKVVESWFGSKAHKSDLFDLLTVPIENYEIIEVDANFSWYKNIGGIMFEASVENPSNVFIEKVTFQSLLFISIILLIVLSMNIQKRMEQFGTFIALALFAISSLSLKYEHEVFHFCEAAMLAYTRAFLFYLLSFNANKHRNFVTDVGFALIALSFVFDVFCAWHSWKAPVEMIHGHDIFVHLLLIAIVGSTIAAMRVLADERESYDIYTILIGMSFSATVLMHDLLMLYPHMEHWFEPKIAFYGVHAIILTVETFFHQGIDKKSSERNAATEL